MLTNTDNLTSPFDPIAVGDVSNSVLVTAFYRYWIHRTLPEIDWSAPEDILVDQLTTVRDPEARLFLEQELWSFRKVYASVGQNDQVLKLEKVSHRSFPESTMRDSPWYTQTAHKSAYVSPAPSALAFARISQGTMVWLALAIVSLVWMAAVLVRAPAIPRSEWVVWLSSALLLGPFALAAHWLVHRSPQTGPAAMSGRPWVDRCWQRWSTAAPGR